MKISDYYPSSIFACVRLDKMRHKEQYASPKTGKYINNNLYLARKYARIFDRTLICCDWEGKSFPDPEKNVSFEEQIMPKDKYSFLFLKPNKLKGKREKRETPKAAFRFWVFFLNSNKAKKGKLCTFDTYHRRRLDDQTTRHGSWTLLIRSLKPTPSLENKFNF